MKDKNKGRRRPMVSVKESLADGSERTTLIPYEEASQKLSVPEYALASGEFVGVVNDLLRNESDRTAAILAAAYLDAHLGDLLRASLVNAKSSENLVDNGALSSFSARIDAAHALGLITVDSWSRLSKIARIRNAFAHQIDTNSFDQDSIRSQCVDLHPTMPLEDRQGHAKLVFVCTAWHLVGEIAQAISTVKRLTEPG